MRAQVNLLPDGRRLQLQAGPIDLIIEAFGPSPHIRAAYDAAIHRFTTILDELCLELPLLRTRASLNTPSPAGKTAQRMAPAVAPYAARTFITPMAAVAGAVAEEILAAMTGAAHLERAYVNDGGDIALHLEPGQQFLVGMIDRPDRASLFGTAVLEASKPVRGIATSGWRGRSFSLGIADAVTVLADQAAMADAAATIIANPGDLPEQHNVFRVRARDVAPDNDLGDHLVTQGVGDLTAQEIGTALGGGETLARTLLTEGFIRAAALHLRSQTRIITFPLHSIKLENYARDQSQLKA